MNIYINGELDVSESDFESKTDLQNYTIQPNDTLSHIDISFDTTIDTLMTLNPQIERPSYIVVGQNVYIPNTDNDNPHVKILPTNGEPGKTVTIKAGSLLPNTTYIIGVGQANSEYEIFEEVYSDQAGKLVKEITIPNHAEEDELWVVVLDSGANSNRLVSNLFLVE